jgi:hypothetical protein
MRRVLEYAVVLFEHILVNKARRQRDPDDRSRHLRCATVEDDELP